VEQIHGDVRVNRQIVGFKKIKFYTGENVGAGQLSMPEQECTPRLLAALRQCLPCRLRTIHAHERQNGLTGLGNAFRTIASNCFSCATRATSALP